MNNLPRVALIGRANVGKSTLFNRLTESHEAIVSSIPGTTRDRQMKTLAWRDRQFTLIDSGGLDPVHDEEFAEDIINQALTAIHQSDLILFVLNGRDGAMPQDKIVADVIRKSRKPCLIVVNKIDHPGLALQAGEFAGFGLGDIFLISAKNGSGTGDLLDAVLKRLPKQSQAKPTMPQIKIAIIGKPNTGKSSIINALLGEERMVTSAKAFTTRTSQDIQIQFHNTLFTIADTAGVRRKAKIFDPLEKLSSRQSLDRLKNADIVWLVTDASEPLSNQEADLSRLIVESGVGLIIIGNKWDLIGDKTDKTLAKFQDYYQRFFAYLTFAPIVFTSAVTKQRVRDLLAMSAKIQVERFREITENALDKFLKVILSRQRPLKGRGTRYPYIYKLKQLSVNPPHFQLVTNYADINSSYLKFVEKQLRLKFGFIGTPLKIESKKLMLKGKNN
ncbi:MAG: ribosome biogenesis GTPase Der [Candidatus Komeilibacteria bacterium]|nr:ribosome biogenesis GTPase Der [Candidatus Komeilibacteria bacterium]